MFVRIFFEVRQRELEQRSGGARTIFLQMDKCAGQLNQPLVKRSVGSVFVLEPQIFEHVVRLVKKLAVETIEITEVMRVEFLFAEGLDQGGDACALVTHGLRLKSEARSPKQNLVGLRCCAAQISGRRGSDRPTNSSPRNSHSPATPLRKYEGRRMNDEYRLPRNSRRPISSFIILPSTFERWPSCRPASCPGSPPPATSSRIAVTPPPGATPDDSPPPPSPG